MSSPSSESLTWGSIAGSGRIPENSGAGIGTEELLCDENPPVASDADAILRRSLLSRGEGKAELACSEAGSDSEGIVERRSLHKDNRETPSLIRAINPEEFDEVAHERFAEACLSCGYRMSGTKSSVSLCALA